MPRQRPLCATCGWPKYGEHHLGGKRTHMGQRALCQVDPSNYNPDDPRPARDRGTATGRKRGRPRKSDTLAQALPLAPTLLAPHSPAPNPPLVTTAALSCGSDGRGLLEDSFGDASYGAWSDVGTSSNSSAIEEGWIANHGDDAAWDMCMPDVVALGAGSEDTHTPSL